MSDSKLTVIKFTAEEAFLLHSSLNFFNRPLTTTNRRIIRPLFKLINENVIPHQKMLTKISDENTKVAEVMIDGQKVKQPKVDQQKVGKEFSKYLKDQKEGFVLSFDMDKELDPLSFAVKYFVTQIWVNILVPQDISEGSLFDSIDEKFCEAIPILGRLVKDNSKPVDEK
jgi:hypothetical protein